MSYDVRIEFPRPVAPQDLEAALLRYEGVRRNGTQPIGYCFDRWVDDEVFFDFTADANWRNQIKTLHGKLVYGGTLWEAAKFVQIVSEVASVLGGEIHDTQLAVVVPTRDALQVMASSWRRCNSAILERYAADGSYLIRSTLGFQIREGRSILVEALRTCDSIPNLLSIGYCFLRARDYEGALAVASSVLVAEPDHSDGLILLGTAQLERCYYADQAVPALIERLSLAADEAEAREFRRLLQHQGELAIPYLIEALDPEDPELCERLFSALEDIGPAALPTALHTLRKGPSAFFAGALDLFAVLLPVHDLPADLAILEAVVERICADPDVRGDLQAFLEHYQRLGDPLVPYLQRVLSESPEVWGWQVKRVLQDMGSDLDLAA